MNTPGIEFGRKTSAAYAALCKPLCQKLHLPQTAFDILMFLANNPGYQTASDVVEVRKLKANLVSVNVDRLVQEGYLVREADPGDRRRTLLRCTEKACPIIEQGRALQEEFGARLLVFCLLYTPCIAAVASVKRELGGKWAFIMVANQCIVAWLAAFGTRLIMML